MKKTILSVFLGLFTFGMMAQTDGITYQAVIIDTNPEQIPGVDIPSNNLPNVPLDVRFSIFNDSNTLEYREIQTTETDAYGMIHLTIGQGSAAGGTGAFNEIYWVDEKTLQVEIDLRDGNGFVDFSSQNLTYIPYVKHREIIATSTLDVDGETNLNSALNVNNQSPTYLSGDLTVDGKTNLNDELNVNNQATTTLTGDLFVEGAAFFNDGNFVNIYVTENSELNVVDISGPTTIEGPTIMNGTATVNNDFTVGNTGSSYLTGSLIVDGETNLNANLNVNNGSTTNLSGDLIVGGQAFFGNAEFENITVNQNSNLNVLNTTGITTLGNNLNVTNNSPTNLSGTLQVSGASTMSSSLTVAGITDLGSTLNVNNNSATNLSGVLTVNDISNLNGQVTIDADVNGSQTSSDSYPLVVRGSDQGIYVISDGSANNTKNYMTFSNTSGGIQGGIEGQNFTDLQNSFEYFHEFEAAFGIEIAFIGAEGFACAAQFDFAENLLMAAQAITSGIYWQAVMDYKVDNRGVYFKSGGADYAEYLEKADATESFNRGEVVGVIGGRISKNTHGADKIMAVSSNPIVLGNLQPDGNQDNFEKIAFMGQVPVRIVGEVAIGDYVLASGNNDGMGIGKRPDEMEIVDYKNIVGVAWEASKGKAVSLVNVAVGINENDLSNKVMSQQKEIDELKAQMKQVLAFLESGKEAFDPVNVDIANDREAPMEIVRSKIKTVADAGGAFNLEHWLSNKKTILEQYTTAIRTQLMAKNFDMDRHPDLEKWLNNPVATIREMNAGTFMPTLWDHIEPLLVQSQTPN